MSCQNFISVTIIAVVGILMPCCSSLGYAQYLKPLSDQRSSRNLHRYDVASGVRAIPSEYINYYQLLEESSKVSAKTVPLRTKFDPESLRISRFAEAPKRPPPLDPEEQMRLQQEYADRALREQQQLALGLGKSIPRQPSNPPSPTPSLPAFKRLPVYYKDDPSSLDMGSRDYDSFESKPISQYKRLNSGYGQRYVF